MKTVEELRAHNEQRIKHWGVTLHLATSIENDPLTEYVRGNLEAYDFERAIDVTAEMVVVGFNK